MNPPRQPGSLARGFTLTEMTVVLVIVALMLGGLLVPLSAQIDMRDTNETRKALAEIREALLGFVIANGYFPCPALPTTANTAAGAGIAPAPLAGGCAVTYGVLPWVTLGVDETDAWGRRYTYVVTQTFTRLPPSLPNGACTLTATQAGFNLCANGDMTIRIASGGSDVANSLPAIVISHGKNGRGAYTPAGTQISTGADVDERENQLVLNPATGAWKDAVTQNIFVKKTPTPTFDDEVVWIPSTLLFNRMVGVGKLP
ncbi:MAG TPA: type II secretion system protein [Accumulibacter sp.]|nr:type II secretion system protein [Accumulibacter sp.]HQC79807.1 type II secretion system protein [Accumulibacter sp.]